MCRLRENCIGKEKGQKMIRKKESLPKGEYIALEVRPRKSIT